MTASLAERGIYVKDAEATWGIKGMIRVSYGNEEESRIFVQALREILS